MPSQSEQERRKQILKDLRQKEKEEFEISLPIRRDLFEALFDYLGHELENKGCDDTLKLTELFLTTKGISDFPQIKKWLGDHGGYCDCEVLANVQQQFEI